MAILVVEYGSCRDEGLVLELRVGSHPLIVTTRDNGKFKGPWYIPCIPLGAYARPDTPQPVQRHVRQKLRIVHAAQHGQPSWPVHPIFQFTVANSGTSATNAPPSSHHTHLLSQMVDVQNTNTPISPVHAPEDAAAILDVVANDGGLTSRIRSN